MVGLDLPGAKTPEPRVKREFVADHATSSKISLRLTFAGGDFSTVTTTQVAGDWIGYPRPRESTKSERTIYYAQ